nr:hypothetical protein [Tanacetum cinerariifolium]GEY68556.1 hypothetical protein [Tanacetum cinerariifolium]
RRKQNLPFHQRTLLKEETFSEFDEYMAMTADENFNSESDTIELPFEKIIINADYKIKTSLEEPHMDLELKPLPDNLEYVFLEEPSFILVIISSQLSAQNKSKLSMFKEGIVLKHKVSSAGLGVDKAKIDVISKLPPPTNIKEIKDGKGTENVTIGQLSQIENEEISDDSKVDDNFPGETLMEINTKDEPWFPDFANYLVADIIPKDMTYQ